MDCAVDVFSAQVSKLSMRPGDKAGVVYACDIALCASLLRSLQSFLSFSVCLLSGLSSSSCFIFSVLVIFPLDKI